MKENRVSKRSKGYQVTGTIYSSQNTKTHKIWNEKHNNLPKKFRQEIREEIFFLYLRYMGTTLFYIKKPTQITKNNTEQARVKKYSCKKKNTNVILTIF